MSKSTLKYKHLSIYDNEEDNKILRQAREKFLSLNKSQRLTDRSVVMDALKKYMKE